MWHDFTVKRKATSRPKQSVRSPIIGIAGLALYGSDALIIEGIQRYAHTHRLNIFNATKDKGFEEMEMNRAFFGGVIASIQSDAIANRLRAMGGAVVNVSNTKADFFGFPAVVPDDRRIGMVAADYFLERGYRNFAVHTVPGIFDYHYINVRAQGFIDHVKQSGFRCCGFKDYYSPEELARLASSDIPLLPSREISLPCAVFGVTDQIAERVCFIEQTKGIKIPQQMAVLGVDNFELYCRMTNPPLSSIDTHAERIGERAAEVMHKLLQGNAVPDVTLIAPGEVVSRISANFIATEDPGLARARLYILEHCAERINVADIVKASGANRRKLEIDFRKHFGSSILHQLNHARVMRANHLIRDTVLPFYRIAELSGFRDLPQMNRVFKRFKQPLPSTFKKNFPREK